MFVDGWKYPSIMLIRISLKNGNLKQETYGELQVDVPHGDRNSSCGRGYWRKNQWLGMILTDLKRLIMLLSSIGQWKCCAPVTCLFLWDQESRLQMELSLQQTNYWDAKDKIGNSTTGDASNQSRRHGCWEFAMETG